MKDPIFICGHRKSGTTMFHSLFDGHSELVVYPSDLNILYAYFPLYLNEKYTKSQRLERLNLILFKDLEFQLNQQGLNNKISIKNFKEHFNNSIADADLLNMREIIEKLLKSYAIITNQLNKRPVIKETSIEIYANEIKQWFPEAIFLHLVRDPRDNYAALKSGVSKYYSNLGEDEKVTLASLINRVSIGFKMGELNKQIFNDYHYHIIKFEDLVKNTKMVMMDLAKKLNIQYNDKLLKTTKLSKPVLGNSFENKKFNKVSDDNINKWRKRISDDEAKIIEFHLGDLMEKYGYNRYYDDVECIKAASEFYKWQNYKYFFSDRFELLK